ncbi:hypothetical protein DENSPDRAFT_140383 [Dentipellis sp. KUC8613]|nr:hypothetical protein DENSPDRAFT_140383 [Dentipellis sp. KUC8613]
MSGRPYPTSARCNWPIRTFVYPHAHVPSPRAHSGSRLLSGGLLLTLLSIDLRSSIMATFKSCGSRRRRPSLPGMANSKAVLGAAFRNVYVDVAVRSQNLCQRVHVRSQMSQAHELDLISP